MKQKDIALIILTVGIASMFSYFVSNKFIAPSDKRKYKAEVVDKITAEFNRPSEKYFNGNSINPTQTIIIGQDGNPKPFSTR